MTNAELISKIVEIHEELTRFCREECQEFNCDYCPYKEILREDDSHDRT